MSSSISSSLYAAIRNGSSIYEGQVKKEEDGELVPDGFGVHRDPKEQYTGQYKDGEKAGFGELKLDDRVLTGSFEAQHRTRIIKYASGYEYQGTVARHTPHGHGIMNYGNGDSYKGHFQHGRPHGWGTKSWLGCGKFSGLWENGSPANRLEGFWDFFLRGK